jgi:spermidine synthase
MRNSATSGHHGPSPPRGAASYKARIAEYYGSACQVQAVQRLGPSGAVFFVVDYPHRSRFLRTLGSVSRGEELIEQSAMDLLRPERLVFTYERLMLVALALVPEARSVLLLGLGGGAMYRHLAAYLPDCAVTVVERERRVVDLARRYFHVTGPVIQGDAEDVVADSSGAFDVVMVDIYDARGAVPVQDGFWQDCVSALKPKGCVAINWAGFLDSAQMREEIGRITPLLGRSFFLTERSSRPNMIQLAPADPTCRLADLEGRVERFTRFHKLPREDRVVLDYCEARSRYPARR